MRYSSFGGASISRFHVVPKILNIERSSVFGSARNSAKVAEAERRILPKSIFRLLGVGVTLNGVGQA